MDLIFHGDPRHSTLQREDLDAAWMPVPLTGQTSHCRFDLLVIGQLERFNDGDGPTYCSAFGRRIGGMVNDAAAENAVALTATGLLATYFAKRRLGWIAQWILRRLLLRMGAINRTPRARGQ